MFDESLKSPPYVDLQAPKAIAPIPEVVAPEHVCINWLTFLNYMGYSHGENPNLMRIKEEKAVDPSYYTDGGSIAGCQDTRRSTSGSIPLLGDRLCELVPSQKKAEKR
ncbi:hypothetical protein Tco_0477742 [Tanacetum coccineum]